jgi:hypothetical protein
MTGVDPLVLGNICELPELTMVKKLSGAVHRQTRRIRD